MKISTTITKKNFEMKMQDLNADGFFFEYKEEKPFWKKRIDSLLKEYDLRVYGFLGKLPEIVFLVGNKPHRFKIVNIFYTHTIPEKYASAINTEYAYGFKCISMTGTEIEDYNRRTGQSIKALRTEPYKSSSTHPQQSHTATVSSSGRQGQGAGDTSH